MKKHYSFHVYILTDWHKKTLYVGMTNNLIARLKEHYDNRGKPETFAGKYYCYYLVYYDWHQYVLNAIAREKEIKQMRRELKDKLIAEFNSDWKFLNIEFCGEWPPKVERRHLDEKDETGSFGMTKGDRTGSFGMTKRDGTDSFGMTKKNENPCYRHRWFYWLSPRQQAHRAR